MKTKNVDFIKLCNDLDFEKIIDHPNILIAANFWEEDRFRAAKICYKLMREIDDLIDNYKSEYAEIKEEERELFISSVNHWISSIRTQSHDTIFQKELIETFDVFKIPLWTMENFAHAMIYDVNHSGFSSLESFLEYSRGASIAPASVFVHLCGVTKVADGFLPPVYDVKRAATPCAIFSYLVHIIRDFQKDQLDNLNYFADNMILKHGLSRQELKEMAEGRKISNGFRSMIQDYYNLADQYRLKTYDMIREISPLLEPRYQLSLEVIFNLYLMVFERINIEEGSFAAAELNPTAAEIKDRVCRTVEGFRAFERKQVAVYYN